MKKILIPMAIVALAAVSCTKDRNCSCTTVTEASGASVTTEEKYTIKDATGGQAKANCVSTKEVDGSVTTTSTCELS